jgi:hypothetical protein
MSILILPDDYLMSPDVQNVMGERAMKYLLLRCIEERKFEAMSQKECGAFMDALASHWDQLRKDGHMIAAEPLESVEKAVTVRGGDGTVSVTDGPFAETKEQIGWFFLINARDLNEAIQVASKFPSVHLGSTEVRPIMEQHRSSQAPIVA